MQAKSDVQLLREYARRGSEPAFSELVARYTDLVYSAALRQVASPDLAQDISQSVFTDLARKASLLTAKLPEGASLIGWLYRSTCYASLTLLRDEGRREAHEKLVMEQFEPASDSSPDWGRVRPLLDAAMANLSDQDRDALLLRFFQSREYRAVGAALGVSDDAAQKRVTRGLEKLRAGLSRRGVTTTAAMLSAALSASAVQSAPAGLAATLAGASLAGAASGTGAALTLLKLMSMTKLQIGAGALIVAGTAATLVIQQRSQTGLRQENESLRQQVAQLQSNNQALSSRVPETNSSLTHEQSSELLRLRGEVGSLRRQTNQLATALAESQRARPASAGQRAEGTELPLDGMQTDFRKEAWTFAGYDTPENALQTGIWAWRLGDVQKIAASLTPEAQRALEGRTAAEILSDAPFDVSKIEGYRILRKEARSDSEIHYVISAYQPSIKLNDGSVRGRTMGVGFTVKRFGNEWRIQEE